MIMDIRMLALDWAMEDIDPVVLRWWVHCYNHTSWFEYRDNEIRLTGHCYDWISDTVLT